MTGTRVIKGAVTTVVISALCFVPPGVHLITGPLSPLIGGFIAGHQFQLDGAQAAIVGLVLAGVIGVPVHWVLQELHIYDLASATLLLLSIIGAVWFGFLGGVMAGVGGGMARKNEETNDHHGSNTRT